MAKFRYYIIVPIEEFSAVTGTNDKKVADAAGQQHGVAVIDTETNMETSRNNPVEIAEEEGYQLS